MLRELPTIAVSTCLTRLLLFISCALMTLPTHAVEPRIKHGWVMARSMVLDENGQPILVEYNDQGDEVRELSLPDNYKSRVDELKVYAAQEYLYYKDRKDAAIAAHEGAFPVSRQEAVTRSFPMANGEDIITISESDLRKSTRSLLIAARPDRLLKDADALILQEYPFDMTQTASVYSPDGSLVVDPRGRVVASSGHTIAPRVGFYGKPGEPATITSTFDPEEDDIFGPVSGVKVYVNELLYPGGVSSTDEDGSYLLQYLLPTCPPGGFEFKVDVWAQLRYQSFSPLGQGTLPYYLRAPTYEYCYASINPLTGRLETIPTNPLTGGVISVPTSQPVQRVNLYADIMFLTGALGVSNPGNNGEPGAPVSIEAPTRYAADVNDTLATATDWYDFDNDGQPDRSVIGRMVDDPEDDTQELVFKADPEGDIQGVYFSGTDTSLSQDASSDAAQVGPDVIRLRDEDRDQRLNQNTGLLSSLSPADLQNTDILVFRAATGELVLERRGLRDKETQVGEVDVGDEGQAGYRLAMRGPVDTQYNIGGIDRHGSFEDWATDYQLTESFQSRDSFHLQPGEFVEVVAINRTTGYMGTQRVQLKSIGDDGTLSVVVEPIQMRPPNLKVWAERDDTVDKGLQQGEKRANIIGAEGAGLLDDERLVVYTEWLDHDGSPLPEGLSVADGADLGLTGRLAKVVAPGVVDAPGAGDLAEFPIAPGRQSQVLKYPDNLSRAEHYYLQVIGRAKNQQQCRGDEARCATFDGTGANVGAEAPLDTRPQYITPFLVPHYDEKKDWLAYREYRQLLKAGESPGAGSGATPDRVEPNRPLPSYAWTYRPEYQFSRLGLAIDEINRVTDPDTADETKDNIYDAHSPVISSSDDLVEVLYSLIGPDFDRLTPIDGGQDFILALGEEETRLALGEDNTLRIDNLDHLAGLDPADFLTMRLYLNQDAGNVLWEYAFNALTLFPQKGDSNTGEANIIELTADQVAAGPQALTAFISGSGGDSDLQRLNWHTVGQGTVSESLVVSNKGVFPTELSLSTVAGATATASANLENNDGLFYAPTFRTVAGIANTMQLQASGKTALGGLGEVEVSVYVQDRFGNSVTNGTQVSVLAPGLSVEGSGITQEGRTTFRFKGQIDSGDVSVLFSVGNIVVTETLTVHDVELTFPNLADVNVDSSKSLEIQADSSYGSLEGLVINLAVHRGKLGTKRVVLDEQSHASVTYKSGNFPGFAQLSALVAGTDTVNTQEFFVVNSGDYLERNVLVTDGSGSIDIGGASLAYGDTTNLVVNAQPGEVVSATLADIFKPPVYALQDFSMGAQNEGNSPDELLILDMSGGMDATGHEVSKAFTNTPFGIGWELGSDSRIDVPEHDRTGNLESAGINLWINAPDEPLGGNTTIVDWDDFGLRLSINAENHLVLTGNFANEEQSVVSANAILPGRWHQVAAHFHGGALKLGVDGKVTTAPTGAPLKKPDNADYALRIKSPEASSLKVAGIKVYDWQGEAKLRMGNGTFDGTATADAQGVAKIPLHASPPQVAYTRAYQNVATDLFSDVQKSIIPNAYAVSPEAEECLNSFDPIPVDAPDPYISEAKRFMDVALDCFVKTRVEQARVNYETSEGLFDKSVALVQRETYEQVYELLKSRKNDAVIVANCLDAVVTGGNASAVGATCDFITGMLAIGDIRDLLIQSWHYHIGDRNEYDPLVANLAGVGLLADGVQLIPGAQGGVVINALTTSFKQVAKLWRSLGAVGQRASRLVGTKLGRIVNDESTSTAKKIDAIKFMLPFAEITGSVALVYQDEPRLFRFLAEMMSSPQTLDRLIVWTKRYLERLESEISPQQASLPGWLQGMVPTAHAATTGVRLRFVNQLRKVLKLGDALGENATSKDIASAFTESLDVFLKRVDESDNLYREIPDDMKVLKAFMVAQKVGGRESVEALAHIRYFSTLGLGASFTREKFVEAVALLPLKKMTAGMGAVQKKTLELELKKMFRKMGNQSDRGVANAKGAQHQFLSTLNRNLAENGDEVTEAFEVRTQISHVNSDGAFSFRVYDERVRIDGELLNLESKAWKKSYLDTGLRRALGVTDKASGQERDRVGQMLSEIVAFRNNEDVFNTRWDFSPELAEAGITKTDIAERLLELVEKDPVIKRNVRRSLGINNRNPEIADEQWVDFLESFKPAVRSNFFKIESYENVKNKLGL